jgi:hypothetical protein
LLINFKEVTGLGIIKFSKQFLPWFMSGKFTVASLEFVDVAAGGFLNFWSHPSLNFFQTLRQDHV